MPPTRGGQQLRVIGGCWRGRKLRFSAIQGLRPTPDRVRETLFNWLAPLVEGARCLDLFAGSGALGIEALSRGAARTVLVERDARVARDLRDNIAVLQTSDAELVSSDALIWLRRATPHPFDIVFLDPPFGQNLLTPACQQLESRGWLAENAIIYLESEPGITLALPANWKTLKDKTAGQVHYQLVRRESPVDDSLMDDSSGDDFCG